MDYKIQISKAVRGESKMLALLLEQTGFDIIRAAKRQGKRESD